LSQMRNLTSIALGMTKISARGIERLLVNEKLDTVLYVPTPELTEADVAALAKRYPRCHFVSKFQKGDQII
ncbi:MAG: hypothetical protein IT343_03930, partial [Candidatus Melainabacteria bacterium]|nr:hypothetical protein [Candidatus Melainabacteria bacterium]